jgi:DNA polymerase-3 subunit epsilon/ATP-dependent DNA helicase DinG
MQTLIALDLETTGLDPSRDAVIEIGVVRFRGSRVEQEWSTLVNPGQPLSPLITQITGITDDMLAGAPRITQVLPDLEALVGDLPILGHNVQFDLDFLRRKGLFHLNEALDTYDLASVLLPSAARYGLGALASFLEVPVKTAHRALDDAQTTRMIFLRFCDLLDELPLELIQEIALFGADVAWGAGWLFDEALHRKTAAIKDTEKPATRFMPRFDAREIVGVALTPAAEITPLDDEAIASAVEPGGALSRHFPGYEYRSQQANMLKAVAKALSKQQHLLVEAGTGIGKSMAYLLPAFAWAEQNGERVVISTNTINLQDQLVHKDVPDLREAMQAEWHAAVLKGRGNYLCPRRLAAMRRIGPRDADEARMLAKALVWLYRGGSGDRNEINIVRGGQSAVWTRLSADSEDCSPESCQRGASGACPYYLAREAAENAHVVIVNHALLLADIATGSRVIPEYRYLIVDEAHHLESATTQGLKLQVTAGGMQRLLRDLTTSDGGMLTRVVQLAQKELPPEKISQVREATDSISARAKDCHQLTNDLFAALASFLEGRREGESLGPYGQQERVLASTRTLPHWSEVEVAWETLRSPLKSIIQDLGAMGDDLAEYAVEASPGAEDLAVALRGHVRDLAEFHGHLESIIFEPAPNTIFWLQQFVNQPFPSLHAAPLEVGPLVEKFLWHEKDAVIMTSATLTTAGEFDFIRRRLNAEDADDLALGSPFDYESSTLLYLVTDIPEPNAGQPYHRSLERSLTALCRATNGRALVLFTSYRQLRRIARAITAPLATDGILVYEQGEGASRHALLETFRAADQAVLLGTRSFWEGVDVPGPALSVLAITRLPFDVPSDPIVAARSETYDSPFGEYMVPEAILRFRQGFGRLIRTKSDRGIAVIYDHRVLSKHYGRAFIDSLPRCTIRQGPMHELPKAAARWLGE